MDEEQIWVLLVDDEPDLAELTSEFLRRQNDSFEIEIAHSAADGLMLLEDHDIDCVVSDYDMPEQNGIEFLDTLRERHPDMPFILYTGKGSEEIASEAISAGVDDYLQKSHGEEQYALLAKRVINAVEKHRSLIEAASTHRFFSKLIQQSTDVIPVIGPNGTLKYVSPSCKPILGYEQDDLIGETVWDYLHPEDVEPATEKFVQTLENPDIMPEVKFKFKHADGSWVTLRGRAKNLLDDPDVEGIVSYNRLVDERN